MYNTEDSDLSFYGKYCTYKIQRGDTLQSVAQGLGIDAKQLRRYHNMHCKIADLIESDFKRYSKFLILAEEKSESSATDIIDEKSRKVSFGSNYNLPFQPRGIFRDYSVEYIFESGNEIDTMEMGIRVNWFSTDVNNYHLFEIHKSINLFIDKDAPDRLMDELELKIAEVIYPLKIVVDSSGKWIDIHNYKEIVARWKVKKNEIFDYYKKDSKVTFGLIEFIEDALRNSGALFESLNSDYFLRSFFNGIHIDYNADYLLDQQVLFPIEKRKESAFKIEQKINSYLNDDGLIEVQQNGYYLNLKTGIDFNNKWWDGKYSAMYYLDSHSCFIEKINLECSIEYDESIKIKVIIESLKKTEKGAEQLNLN